MSDLLDRITVNSQSSIRIESERIWRFDPYVIAGEPHDADFVLITHAHFDHFSPDDLRKVLKEDTTVVMPESVIEKAGEAGFDTAGFIGVKPGDKLELGGAQVEVLYSYNTNKPNHLKEFGWVGYMLTLEGRRIYIAGDTDVIPEQDGLKCDIMMIPVGGTYTMDEREAAELVNRLMPPVVIPIHYGTVINDPQTGERFAALVDPAVKVEFRLFR